LLKSNLEQPIGQIQIKVRLQTIFKGILMKFTIKFSELEKMAADCFIIGIFENNTFTNTAAKFDKISHHYLSNLLKNNKDFKGKLGQVQMLYQLPHLKSPRVLLVGCGRNTSLSVRDFRKIVAQSTKILSTSDCRSAINFLTELEVERRSLAWKIKYTVGLTRDVLYRFDQFKSEKESPASLNELLFTVQNKQQITDCQQAIREGVAIANGVELTKNLGNLPSNICTPTYLANQSKKLADLYPKISVKTLNKKEIKQLGMGAFYAVAQGSTQDAKLVCITYQGSTKKQSPTVFVGKGVTFDTGGINSKTAEGMVGMKYDMCGAATILGVIKAAAELKLPLHIVGLLACVENMPDGGATKPEDIVETLSGQTVEILNTDAEGRLILCDALTFAERFKPEVVIDIATLTYAVVVALGHHATGLVSNDEPLAKALLEAGTESHDRAWQMPLWEDYQDLLKSPFADMTNTAGRMGGVITSSCFLSRFTKKFRWAHLDVAGTAAIMGGSERMATGRPVPLLMHYLLKQCK
jgi:leucyl aminopeptidase